VGCAGLPSGTVPPWSRDGELTGPASKIIPDSLTPGTVATFIAVMSRRGTRAGKPSPSTIAAGRVTWMVWFRW
jgi:hypothetical protein